MSGRWMTEEEKAVWRAEMAARSREVTDGLRASRDREQFDQRRNPSKRSAILNVLTSRPEAMTRIEIARQVGMAPDQIRWLLRAMTQEGAIISAGEDRYQRAAPAPFPKPMSPARKKIVTYLTTVGGRTVTPLEIAARIGSTPAAVGYLLKQMLADGQIERRGYGGYGLPPDGEGA